MTPRTLRRNQLRRYQVVIANKIKRLKSTILALDMGAGKTGSTLTAMVDMLDDGVVRRVLVVAPLLVAAATWPDEIETWDHTRDLEWTLIRAEDDDVDVAKARQGAYSLARDTIGMTTKEAQRYAGRHTTRFKEWKRRRLASTETEVHIVNKEALPWLWDFFDKGKSWPYDMLVIDEASMFKNGKMRTPKKQLSRFGVVAKARKSAKKIVQLTGTPAPKGLQNLWGLAFIADGGDRLGNKKFHFERRWFQKDYMGWNLEARPKARDEIMDRLSDIMFSLGPEHYPELPPMTPVKKMVNLPNRVLEEYRNFERSLYSEEYDVEAVNNGVLHGKLLQFANGSMYNEFGDDVWIHDEKLGALEDIYDEANGEPVLVAYSYKFDLARIRKRFKKAVVFGEGDVRETKRRWNNGDISMMLAHPNSVGHGQNLQFGGSISAWYGMTPDLELYQQFNKRLLRPGQTRPVFNHHIIAKGTYDETILPILADRAATQDDIIASVRVNLRPLLTAA